MSLRQPVKYGLQPKYPANGEAIDYADNFRQHHQAGGDDNKSWWRYEFNAEVDAFLRGWPTYYYLVVCWPVAGFVIAYLPEVAQKEDWRAWVLEYDVSTDTYEILASSHEDGKEEFKRIKHICCPSDGEPPPPIQYLNDLLDVQVPTPVDGDVLYRDEVTSKWKAKQELV